MKIFVSYKFAGENPKEIEGFMKNVKVSLTKAKHEMLTTFFDKEELNEAKVSLRKVMDRALEYINKSDKILCIIKSQEPSQGMNFEIGYAVAKNKKIILAIQKDLKTRWIEHYAEKIIMFDNLGELYKKLASEVN